MTTSVLFQMTTPAGENIEVPYHDIGDPGRLPRIALVSGLRADELNGIFVLSRLSDYLRSIQRGDKPDQRLRARVVIVPAVNTLALNTRDHTWPFDKTDINRMFPGSVTGETGQRIAHAVLEATRSAYYRVDIQSANPDFEELPQVRLYEASDDERSSAFLFGLPAIIERPRNPMLANTLDHAWQTLGGENFLIRIGQAGGLQLRHCERLFRALVSFLIRTDILEGVELSEEEEDVHHFGPHQKSQLIAESGGIFVSKLAVGHWVQAGEIIGSVYDAFAGQVQAEIKTPCGGLLTAIRRQPLVCEGYLVARLQTY